MIADVIIPNFNGAALLPECLDALRRQTRQDFGVTIVDDGSTDRSLVLIANDYPEVNTIPLGHNHGLAAAINIAIEQTTAPIVVLLNNDTEAHPEWFEHLVGALERFPSYDFAASKLLLFDQRSVFHSAGDGYTASGIPYNRGVWQIDRGQFDAVQEVWGPCAGAAAYRRSALSRLAIEREVLDSDLFMYCEDVDLNLRARLAGIRTLFVPRAIVYHQLSATGGGILASYYNGRNSIAVWVKNMPTALIQRHFGAFLLAQAQITLSALRHSAGAEARARLRGQIAGICAIPRFMAKRHLHQQVIANDQLEQMLAG